MRQCVMHKNWFTIFNIKVTTKVYKIRIWLFLLYFLYCWSICNQTWFDCIRFFRSCSVLLKMWLLHSRLRSQRGFYMSVNVCLDDILWTAEHFVSKLAIIIINPLTTRVVGAPQMILQPVFSIFPSSPMPSGTCWTPGLSILWCCLPTSSFVHLVFFPLSLCLARWFWPDLMKWETWSCHCSLCLFTIVRRSSCGPIACWILAQTSSLVTWSLYEMCSILR